MKKLLTLLLLLAPSREIQMGELAMKFLRFLVIGMGRLFGRTEGTQMNPFSIMANPRIPFPITLMPTHSLETTRIIATNACIPLILGMAGLAKILLSIVESVVVFMVYFLRWITVKNYLMHKYVASAPSIKSVRSLIPTSIPILLIQSFKVFSINNCILPLCQSNKTVGLVKRLDNRMAFHSAFHWSSMKGLMNFSRYIILFALILLVQSAAFGQNPVSGGPIPQATYTTPPVNANPTHGTGAPTGTCMSGILYTNDSNGNLYSCNAGTWGLAGGTTGVTHTGNLTLNSMLLGNGVADVKIDTACLTNGTGALSGCTSLSAGSGASAAGATATGGFACVEGTSTGWTPTAGQGFIRCDNTLDNYVVSIPLNGATVTPLPVFNAVPVGSKCLQSSGVAGLVAETASVCGTATISGLTTGFLPKASSATAIANSLCDEGITAANTLTCTDTAGLAIPKIGTGTAPPACAVATSAWCGVESVPPTAVAGVDDLWPDTTDHSWKAHSNGNGIELVALIAPVPVHQTAKTAAITTATLCTAANCGVAGNYTIEWAFTQVGTACGTPGAGGVTFLLTWTDQNAVTHSAIQMPMDDAASLVATTGTFHFTTSNATAWGSGNMNISSNGAILQYATGYTACGVGTGSYQLDAWVTRKQ